MNQCPKCHKLKCEYIGDNYWMCSNCDYEKGSAEYFLEARDAKVEKLERLLTYCPATDKKADQMLNQGDKLVGYIFKDGETYRTCAFGLVRNWRPLPELPAVEGEVNKL